MKEEKEQTKDSLFDGQLVCFQHKEGYRFSLDALLLAHFITVHQGEKLLDLGTGCGIIPLIVLYRHQNRQLYCCGMEIQPELAALAKKNFLQNGMEQSAVVLEGDLRNIGRLIQPESFQQVVCNPPFYKEVTGRVCKNREAGLARHQQNGGLGDFLQAARFALVNRGRASFIYPAEQCAEFLIAARTCGLEVKYMRHVHGYPGLSARLTLFGCVKNGRPELDVAPPLFIYREKNGDYTEELARIYLPSQSGA